MIIFMYARTMNQGSPYHLNFIIFSLLNSQLETDAKILLDKADMALRKYKMNAVVANELLTRNEEVIVVTDSEKISVKREKTEAGSDVENPLVKLLVDRHSAFIRDSNA